MQYGKLENGYIRYAPNNVVYNGNKVYNPTDEILILLGYLPVELGVDLPYKEGFYVETTYEIIEETQTPEGEIIPKHISRIQEYKEDTTTPIIPEKSDLELRIEALEKAFVSTI